MTYNNGISMFVSVCVCVSVHVCQSVTKFPNWSVAVIAYRILLISIISDNGNGNSVLQSIREVGNRRRNRYGQ
ncbi:hypothetical protein Y032_1509g3902 [Ancylostoma ceylanicum]|uniref:Secreted protein n=1 Tax=Ancylostoma ceylanicum TaxID=53326 RepID=A0A016W626_9BILA|nr:hypothetical protein Y032_1509g3902 [Ancylostoma ceylanicum]